MKKLFVLILILTVSFSGFTQKKDIKSHEGKHHDIHDHTLWKKTKTADNLFKRHSYYNAVDIYSELLKELPDNEYLNYRLALTYFKARDYSNAEKYFQKSTSIGNTKSSIYPLSWFYYAETLQMQAKYSEAKEQFLTFNKVRSKAPEVKIFKKYAVNSVRACSYAQIESQEDTAYVNVDMLNGGINKAYTDFSPYPKGDTLFFASRRMDSVISFDYSEEKIFPVRLFQSVQNGENWSEPEQVPGVNSDFDHSANGTFSSDKKRFYFTKCSQDPDNNVVCHIYMRKLENGVWTKPHKLHKRVNGHGYTSTMPSVGFVTTGKKKSSKSSGSEVLYFVSNRPGGKGGLDIWYSPLDENGAPGSPVNCGGRINTLRDEVSPFYDNHTGRLFFSSNFHYGFGGYDIFIAKGKEKRFAKPVNAGIPINCSYDDTYYVPQKDEDRLDNGFLVSNRPGGIALTSPTCCDDIYSFQEFIPPMISLVGEISENKITDDKLREGIDSTKMVASIDTLGVPQLDTTKGSTMKIDVKNIDGVAIGFVKQRYVNKAKEMEASGLTYFQDKIVWADTSTAEGNYRVDSLVEGVNYSLVVKKEGYETRVIALDSVMRKAVNRVAVLDVDVFKQILDSNLIASNENQKTPIALSLDIKAEDISEDNSYVLENMYFEFDKDQIKKESLSSCELLVAFLEKHPKVHVQIQGHTDSRGDDNYNLKLSDRRAKSVVKYCVNHGISEKRLEHKGFGESSPIAPNENKDGSDNPKGRALNRRTEVKIIAVKSSKGNKGK